MNDPIRMLKADHREAKRMLKELAGSRPGLRREALVSRLEEALSLHMAIEEEVVYPKVVEHLGEETDEEAETEHELARKGLATVREFVERPGFGAAVQMLMAGITHHVKEEETEILPKLKAQMEDDAWAAMGDAVAEARSEAGVGSSRARA